MSIIPSPSNPTATQNEESASIGEARLALVDSINWLERLTTNPDFVRYLEFVKKGADAVKRDAENISSNDAPKRDAFAQRYFGLLAMAEWPKKNLDASQLALKALDEKSSKLQS